MKCNGLSKKVMALDTETIHENFKLWITSKINKNFPMSLLQMLIKYTNEPPQVRPMVNAVNTGLLLVTYVDLVH